jgi:DNA-binding NtrC family response regulator
MKNEIPKKILVIDDNSCALQNLFKAAAKKAAQINLFKTIQQTVDYLEQQSCDILFFSNELLDSRKTGITPFDFINVIKGRYPNISVVLTTQKQKSNQQDIDFAVRATQAGFKDVLVKPIDYERAENLITGIKEKSIPEKSSVSTDSINFEKIIGKSKNIKQTIDLAERIAPTSAAVLISGQSGTGKELVSRLIHQLSRRSDKPFIQVNCAALSDTLLESELFGHEKGAFTGADNQRKGRFELADSGTLLLDEITETPKHFQAKLLRVIEQQRFERVGGNQSVSVNVRIISTTNKDLSQQVKKGKFREDLYYRLSGVRLVIPALKDRPDDIEDLVWHFVGLYSQETNRDIKRLDDEMLKIFKSYSWPGNVRQLRNIVLTSLILGEGEKLRLADVSWVMQELGVSDDSQGDEADFTDNNIGGISLDKLEKQAIMDTLRKTEGNRTKAAEVLGISDRTLRSKIHRYKKQGQTVAV